MDRLLSFLQSLVGEQTVESYEIGACFGCLFGLLYVLLQALGFCYVLSVALPLCACAFFLWKQGMFSGPVAWVPLLRTLYVVLLVVLVSFVSKVC